MISEGDQTVEQDLITADADQRIGSTLPPSEHGLCRICGQSYYRRPVRQDMCSECTRVKLLRDGIVHELVLLRQTIEAMLTKVNWGANEKRREVG